MVRLRNFKRFLDQSFVLTGLTVLTGLNSSGKSTLVQSLLLAHQAGLSPGDRVPLNAKPGLRLGQPVDLLALDATTTTVEVEIDVDESTTAWAFETQFDGFEEASYVLCDDARAPTFRPIYLGAERLGPRTSHGSAPAVSAAVGDIELGDDGRFVAHALAVHARRDVAPDLVHPNQPRVTTLASQTEAWMSELVGAIQFEARLVPRTDITTLHVRSSSLGDWLLPTNVGFGISYALPVIVAGLTARPGDLLVIDSPEAHLHPAAQSAVARFLARVSSCGVQVIVETHSDHVLNGIRRSVVSGEVASDTVTIHFLAGRAEPERITIDQRGRPDHWPAGFFDQMEVDLRSITRPRPTDR